MARKPARTSYDINQVRALAHSQWRQILTTVGRCPAEFLTGSHTECPKCGGSDRFRFSDMDGGGSVICNQCAKDVGDGFAAIQWLTGCSFYDALCRVAEFLGVPPTISPAAGGRGPNGNKADPAEHLEFDTADRSLAIATWCLSKSPIVPDAVLSTGGRIARYRDQFTVVALPHHGSHGAGSPAVGWTLYNQSGGTLPKYPPKNSGKSIEWKKIKVAHGSRPGLIGDLERARRARVIWKVEGPSDCLALLSLATLPSDHAVVTNANGAGEKPDAWMIDLFRGKIVHVLHDADVPGQRGACGHTDERGRFRPGWLQLLAPVAAEVRNVGLPFPIAETHGKDLRDFLNEGGTFEQLQQLAAAAWTGAAAASPSPTTATPAPAAGGGDSGQVVGNVADSAAAPKPIESDDDPHRLAAVNLAQYAATNGGATLRYWRGEWFTWKPARGCYRRIEESELRAKISASIKAEFNRLNLADQVEFAERGRDGEKEPEARKVTKTLVTNVLAATASLVCIPNSTEPLTWVRIDPAITSSVPPSQPRGRHMVAMRNGLIDIDRILGDAPLEESVLPHTPDWFSTIRLPYGFERGAAAPKWEAFLEKNLEMDPERIKLLQEWAGYLLLPDTGQQKFLVLEGEGSNGKSVYCAAIAAMLGLENCSHVPLEQFGERFPKTQTIGKLVNICADVGELDKIAEGYLKSFTSGDVMFFDRKGIAAVECVPTARLMFACNNRPRFTDRSGGIWRRMLIIPWNVEITRDERVPNMDKAWWWEQQGELPGIFWWALKGLARLRQQGRFTESTACREALEEYRLESNPARAFLLEFCDKSSSQIPSHDLYELYVHWTEKSGYRPLGERVFGKEIRRVFPWVNRQQVGGRANRHWTYTGLTWKVDEILGRKTEDRNLF